MQYESTRSANTPYSGASLLIELLKRQGTRIVAGIPGGANLPIYDALGRSDLRHVLVRHEQAGGFLAQGMARSTGTAATCFATSGPGAVNLLTAVADAKLDSVPIVAVTGQVSSATDRHRRVPGSGHVRDEHPGDQAQLPRAHGRRAHRGGPRGIPLSPSRDGRVRS